jgi:hypothetical protein
VARTSSRAYGRNRVRGRGRGLMRSFSAMAAAISLLGLLGACSAGLESPSGFPAVHDMPAPRAEAPMTPEQVKQATDTLISERDRLGSQQPAAAAQAAPATTGSTKAGTTKAGGNKTTGSTKTAGAADKPQ